MSIRCYLATQAWHIAKWLQLQILWNDKTEKIHNAALLGMFTEMGEFPKCKSGTRIKKSGNICGNPFCHVSFNYWVDPDHKSV